MRDLRKREREKNDSLPYGYLVFSLESASIDQVNFDAHLSSEI